MPDEVTATTEDLKAQFDEARLVGDHARLEAIGRQLYPEPAVVERIAPAPPATPPGVAQGSLSPRAVITAIKAELEKNRGHQTEQRRQELLRQLNQAYQQDFEESERAEAAARVEPAAPRDPDIAVAGWPAPMEGHTWSPGLNPMVARLVGRGLDVDTLKHFAGARGPDDPPDDVPRETAVAARFAMDAYFPDRSERELVNDWLDKTGNANNRALIEYAAELGRPLLAELRQAHAERRALDGMNQGAPGYADTAASLAARYQHIYGGG